MTSSIFAIPRAQMEQWLMLPRPHVHAGRIFKVLYKQNYRPEELYELFIEQQLNRKIILRLFEEFSFDLGVTLVSAEASSQDGSVKFLLRLNDGLQIESVLIPERGRLTQCISTQVGCAQGCVFCHTGRMGLKRNLQTHEIVGQVVFAQRWIATKGRLHYPQFASYHRVTNVVYMGMGEPLDNLDAVLPATQIFTDNHGLNFSPHRVTLSTVGLLPALQTFLEHTNASVALSLHSPISTERSRIIPANRKNPLEDVLAVLRNAAVVWDREFFIQYILLRDVNDSLQHAEQIVECLQGIPAKINLIPLNEHKGTALRRPDLSHVHRFQMALKRLGMVATVRLSKGRDIAAACGQLVDKQHSPMA